MSTIDKSKSPYFDDFTSDKKYHEVLYRPKRSVQTRELNQIQSMFNEQMNKGSDRYEIVLKMKTILFNGLKY